jgi:hypothetical protein
MCTTKSKTLTAMSYRNGFALYNLAVLGLPFIFNLTNNSSFITPNYLIS